MTGTEFVRGVMERLGVASAAALADAMRWPRGKERTVARWLAGETNPSYESVIEMVERAGLLSSGEVVQSAGANPGDPLLALEGKVDKMAARTADALGRLEGEVKRLSARIPPSAEQSQETA